MPNGLICLKGGELEHETMPFKHKTVIHSLSENFEEEFFETKKVVYSQYIGIRSYQNHENKEI